MRLPVFEATFGIVCLPLSHDSHSSSVARAFCNFVKTKALETHKLE